jgi:hypothetical protein
MMLSSHCRSSITAAAVGLPAEDRVERGADFFRR